MAVAARVQSRGLDSTILVETVLTKDGRTQGMAYGSCSNERDAMAASNAAQPASFGRSDPAPEIVLSTFGVPA
jgi:hypothetical protein